MSIWVKDKKLLPYNKYYCAKESCELILLSGLWLPKSNDYQILSWKAVNICAVIQLLSLLSDIIHGSCHFPPNSNQSSQFSQDSPLSSCSHSAGVVQEIESIFHTRIIWYFLKWPTYPCQHCVHSSLVKWVALKWNKENSLPLQKLYNIKRKIFSAQTCFSQAQ